MLIWDLWKTHKWSSVSATGSSARRYVMLSTPFGLLLTSASESCTRGVASSDVGTTTGSCDVCCVVSSSLYTSAAFVKNSARRQRLVSVRIKSLKNDFTFEAQLYLKCVEKVDEWDQLLICIVDHDNSCREFREVNYVLRNEFQQSYEYYFYLAAFWRGANGKSEHNIKASEWYSLTESRSKKFMILRYWNKSLYYLYRELNIGTWSYRWTHPRTWRHF